jgi:signal transduction histidine kinase
MSQEARGEGGGVSTPSESRETLPLVSDALGILAHDLRNPIAALLSNVGYLNMAAEDFSADVRETLVDLELSIEALARMTGVLELLAGDLLQAAPRRPAGPFSPALSLDAIWAGAVRAAKSHDLNIAKGLVVPNRAIGSEAGVQIALQALVHNSIMCSPARSTVVVSIESRATQVVIAVEDTGPPLAPIYRRSAFTLAGPTQTKGKIDGRYSRGLGLYVAGREAALSGADLVVADVPRGNRFELVLGAVPA